jgi:fatty acid desaturase
MPQTPRVPAQEQRESVTSWWNVVIAGVALIVLLALVYWYTH